MAEPEWASLTKKALHEVMGGVSKHYALNTAVLAATDIIAADLEPTYTSGPTRWRIYVVSDTAGILDVQRTAGGVTVVEQLNNAANLTVNAIHTEDIIVQGNDSINFQFSAIANLITFIVVEIRGL